MAETTLDEKAGFLDYQYDIFCGLISKLTSGEGLVFNTVFARISYLGIKYRLKKDILNDLHIYRKEYDKKKNIAADILFDIGKHNLKELLKLAGLRNLGNNISLIKRPDYQIKSNEIVKKKLHGRYNLISKKNSEEYIVVDDDDPTLELVMRVDNLETFKNAIDYINHKIETGDVPVVISLVYIDIDSDGVLMPQMIILQPDYLVDVTAIAECFKPFGGHSKYYLLNKLSLDPYSIHITIGNIVNYFLDEIITNPDIQFDDVVNEIFQLDPIRFSLMEDSELKSVIVTLKTHFDNVKRVISEDFKSIYLDVEKCILEPSFYSPVFGLQGRLDVFHQKKKSNEAAIIELKSGKLFMPNVYGLNTNHYTQTLLYELMIRSVYNFDLKPINFILYSALDKTNIRFAPTISAQQREAISIRNDIVEIEEKIINGRTSSTVFDIVNPENFPGASGFISRDLGKLDEIIRSMNDVEKAYYGHFASFIAREQKYSKTGYYREGITTGQSTLWLLNEKQKSDQFSILQQLKLIELSVEDSSTATLEKTINTNELANFRKGDIVLLYPYNLKSNSQIESQIFKCTITDLLPDRIIVKLRTRIRNLQFETKNTLWNLEHDYLDTGFSKMHTGLIKFFSYPQQKRDIILTVKPPLQPEITPAIVIENELTEKQSKMVDRIVACEDYFLLWGPPGTGKTSKIIRAAVERLLKNNENIMLVAYTNRAVDELCEAVENISENSGVNYIRIGSRYSCDEKYHDKLLDSHVRNLKTRSKLKELIKETSIFISTVSSLLGKEEIFRIKNFNTIIVDEASQLLEPMIISILPNFRRFVLVGDHMQLPAVVSQSKETTIVDNKDLKSIGLTDLSNSLFERMFSRAIENKWEWAYGMLDEQGRMHETIMVFPNSIFYDNKLKTIDAIDRLTVKRMLIPDNELQKKLIDQRLVYLPSETKKSEIFAKNNEDEADKIVKLISEWIQIYKLNGLDLENDSIGVITTFRAQIATIKNKLLKAGIDTEIISIDTVERYQGSARDIIIYSMAVNSVPRFEQVINTDKNELDRKLNVVITRAKEHFIILGNEEILRNNKLYGQLIGEAYRIEIGV